MSDYEYTPTTEDVRDAYALSRVNLFAQGYTEQGDRDRSARADFDRWLAQHEAEVAAAARDFNRAADADLEGAAG